MARRGRGQGREQGSLFDAKAAVALVLLESFEHVLPGTHLSKRERRPVESGLTDQNGYANAVEAATSVVRKFTADGRRSRTDGDGP